MKRKLTITLDADWKNMLRNAGSIARKGLDSGHYQGEHLNFETPAILFSRLTPNRWEMVRTLQGNSPLGVRELARHLGRDVRRVHDDAKVLLELGLIEKSREGKLFCPYEDIHLDMHMKAA